MKPLQPHEIKGNWATLLLPINENDTISYERLGDEISTLIEMGVDGIYSNGSAGEFYNQTEEEFIIINSILAEKCNAARMPFQIGCSHMDPRTALSRVETAKKLKPSAIQVILPDWIPPTIDEAIRYLKLIVSTAEDIGVVLYNPPHAKKVLLPEEFYRIQQAGIGIAGCKTIGGDSAWYEKMHWLVPEISIFVPGHHLATGISLGARGAYSNVACLHPKVAQSWYEMMLHDMDAALEMEKKIQLFLNQYIVPFIDQKKFSNPAVDKLLAAIGGWADIGTRLRWPYRGIPTADVAAVRERCIEMLPEFFPLTSK